MDDDYALLDAWQAGEADAGNRLFHRHFDRVARFFQNKVGEGLEDLIQETFLACVESRERFRREGSFRAYLLGIAGNVVRAHYRRRGRGTPELDFAVSRVIDLAPSPSAVVAERAQARLLLEGLRAIPLDAQILLELYYWEQMRGPELAAALGVPEGTVRTRLRRARQHLDASIRALAGSEDAAITTLTRLEDWAREIRQAGGPAAPEP